MTNKGFAGFPSLDGAVPDGSIGVAKLGTPSVWGRLVSGYYYFTTGVNSINTSNTQGNGTLRLSPWVVPNACTLSKIGCDISSAGDGTSLLRLGIYADNGSGYPGLLLLDSVAAAVSGTIDGSSNTLQDVTISLTLAPGLYWIGGAVQGVTVTQPTVRIGTGALPLTNNMLAGTSKPSAATTVVGFSQSSVTAALPGQFTTTVTTITTSPRIHVKVA